MACTITEKAADLAVVKLNKSLMIIAEGKLYKLW